MNYNNRVLIIDDDQAILDIFSSVLMEEEQAGKKQAFDELSKLVAINTPSKKTRSRTFTVDTATQGEEGVQKVQSALAEGKPYSVVFTDMRMPPGWDGAKTAQQIRKIDPFVEIIIVTAYADASIAQIVKQVRFTDRLLYLKKPFDDEEILQLADSLSMRWNLEAKVRGMVYAVETMINNYYALNKSAYNADLIYPFLNNAIQQVAIFLETKDVLIAQVLEGKIVLKVGLGCFQSDSIEVEKFDHLLQELANKAPMTNTLKTSIYTVIPMSGQSYYGFMIALSADFEIEGTHKLLAIMASNISKFFDIIMMMSEVHEKNRQKDEQIDVLKKRIKELEAR